MNALARVPIARVLRTPKAWGTILVWGVLGLVVATTTRARGLPTGADHVMRGTFAVFVLPLLAYAVVGATQGGNGLRRSIRGVVTFGVSPRRAALVTSLVAIALASALAAVVGALLCVVAHGVADPPLAGDLFASAWVSGLGGAAYAALFLAGSAVGSGAARGVFLALDWILGDGGGIVGMLLPRAHVSSLLGGSLASDLSPRVSSVLLVALVALYLTVAVSLSKRA